MKQIETYCVRCNNFGKFANVKISYIFGETPIFSIICSKFRDTNNRITKEKERTEILKILSYIESRFHVHLINMSDEMISQESPFCYHLHTTGLVSPHIPPPVPLLPPLPPKKHHPTP